MHYDCLLWQYLISIAYYIRENLFLFLFVLMFIINLQLKRSVFCCSCSHIIECVLWFFFFFGGGKPEVALCELQGGVKCYNFHKSHSKNCETDFFYRQPIQRCILEITWLCVIELWMRCTPSTHGCSIMRLLVVYRNELRRIAQYITDLLSVVIL